MDGESLVKLAEARAQSDTRTLKKVIHAFYALVDPSATGDKLHAAHASFHIALDQLSQLLDKADRIAQVTASEVAAYAHEVAALERASTETSDRLGQLGHKLREAQQERARRIEYDGLAKVIARLPDRHKGLEQQQRLESDIALLESESRTYAETWQARKLAFDAIVHSLETMQEAIRDEKAEQERRRALDEDDAEPGAAGTGAAEDGPAAAAAAAPALDPTAEEFVPLPTRAAVQGDGDVPMGDAPPPPARDPPSECEEGQMTDDQPSQE